jgi:hypothetical protein
MKWMQKQLRKILSDSLLNPVSWIAWSLIFLSAWAAFHLLGWRIDTAVISGTVDPARGNPHTVMFHGTLYALAYFASTILSPILLLASAIYITILTITRRPKKLSPQPATPQLANSR